MVASVPRAIARLKMNDSAVAPASPISKHINRSLIYFIVEECVRARTHARERTGSGSDAECQCSRISLPICANNNLSRTTTDRLVSLSRCKLGC